MGQFAKKYQLYLIALLLAVITSAVYIRMLTFDFISVYDDRSYILKNPIVQRGLTSENFDWAFRSTAVYNWHPLTWISHMLDCSLYGLKAGGHHATSLLLHIASTVFLFLALTRMTRSPWKSAFVAALFGVHPAHVESVAWIAERKDVLSGFFWMLTMYAYAFYVERPSTNRYLLVAGAFALGLMSKPMLVTLPCILLLLDYWPLGRFVPGEAKSKKKQREMWIGWKLLREKALLLLMTVGSSIATFVAQQQGGAVQSLDDYTPGIRIANALVSYIAYIEKTIWPTKLAVLYPHPGRSLPIWEVLGAAALLIAVTALVIRVRRRWPYLPVGWLWYLGTLVPVIGLIQVGKQAMANRYTYIPIIGLFIMAAWGIPEAVRRVTTRGREREGARGRTGRSRTPTLPHSHTAAILAALACLVVAVMAVAAWFQVGHWRNSITLFYFTVKVTEKNPHAQGNLGWAYIEKRRFGDAIGPFSEALRLLPSMYELYYGRGACYLETGQLDKAIQDFNECLRASPGFEPASIGLSRAMQRQWESRRTTVGPEAFRKSVDHYNQGVEADNRGDSTLAFREYQEAVRLRPDFADAHCNMGIILKDRGRLDESLKEYREAVRYNPGLTQVYNNIAVVYYMKRDYAHAWAELHKAQKLGYVPDSSFIQALSQKMPEPSE